MYGAQQALAPFPDCICFFFLVCAAYSRVVENTAFFGDVLLRFPKIVHGYFDPNVRWQALARWGIDFCNRTGVFDTGTYSKLLMLVSETGRAGLKSNLSLVIFGGGSVWL